MSIQLPKTTIDKCIALDTSARDKANSRKYDEAIMLWEELASIVPEWEGGLVYNDLAITCEDAGYIDKALEYYKKAMESNALYDIVAGNYASFLYNHGSAKEAFSAYLHYLSLSSRNSKLDSEIMQILYELGDQLGLTHDEVSGKINEAGKQQLERMRKADC